jgi:glycosyltransferase involved in cell wall biosynthesis
VRRLRLRDLSGPPPEPGRVLWSGLWFRTHNNARYAELLPRLERLDALFLTCSGRRVPRGIQFRAYRGPAGAALQRAVLARAAGRYRGFLCTELRQIALSTAPAVVDVDDPYFDEPSLGLLLRPNVACLVTVARWAVDEFRRLGVTAPIEVVPQGVDLSSLDPAVAADVRARLRREGDLVVGYTAAVIGTGEDRGLNPLYDTDHLLELWTEIRARVPGTRLWLVGEPTASARRRLGRRDDVLLVGRVPRDRLLAHTACFDVALYPRLKAAGIMAVKLAEYMGAGVPTVAYDYPVTACILEAGAGVLVSEPRRFVDAVVRLLEDPPARARLAEAARAAGREHDWAALARRYEAEVLDRYLPPPVP